MNLVCCGEDVWRGNWSTLINLQDSNRLYWLRDQTTKGTLSKYISLEMSVYSTQCLSTGFFASTSSMELKKKKENVDNKLRDSGGSRVTTGKISLESSNQWMRDWPTEQVLNRCALQASVFLTGWPHKRQQYGKTIPPRTLTQLSATSTERCVTLVLVPMGSIASPITAFLCLMSAVQVHTQVSCCTGLAELFNINKRNFLTAMNGGSFHSIKKRNNKKKEMTLTRVPNKGLFTLRRIGAAILEWRDTTAIRRLQTLKLVAPISPPRLAESVVFVLFVVFHSVSFCIL